MDRVTLPKSTKKLYYYIFRGINLTDILVFLNFILIASIIAFMVPAKNIWKVSIAITVLFIGVAFLQQDNNELRIYEKSYRFFKYLAVGYWKSSTVIYPQFKEKNPAKKIISLNHLNQKLFLGGVKLQSTNLQLLNQYQQMTLVTEFANLLRAIALPCKMIKINESYNFEKQKNWIQNKKNNQLNLIASELLDLQLDQLNTIQESANLTTPGVYLIWISKNETQSETQLKTIMNCLAFSNLVVETLKQNQLNCMWKDFNFHHEVVNNSAKKINFTKTKSEGFIWAINNLPKQINYFWLSELFNLSNSNICINLNPITKTKAKKRLDDAFNKIITNANNYANTESQKYEAEVYKESFLQQQQAIADDTDVLKEIAIFIIVKGNKQEITTAKRELNDLAIIKGWKYDKLDYLQTQALIAVYSWNNYIDKATEFEMTCDTFATAFPIPDMPLNDDNGFLIAETISGKPVVWDLFQKGDERPNKNMLILGESGSGKSFTIKKILLNQIYRDSQIFILDPEREYLNLTQQVKGKWIDVSGTKDNIINPWEIYKLQPEDDNADIFNSQIGLVHQFFNLLFPKLNEEDQIETILIELIEETYLKHKIFPSSNFNNFKTTDFPTFTDLYNLICQKLKTEKVQLKIIKLENLKSKLTALTKGIYAKFWNGYTKFKWDTTNFTCFDLQGLTNGENPKIVNVQMLLILRLLSREMIVNKTKAKKKNLIIVVDEAHLLVNENNPVALDFLFHTMKRIRKTGGSLIIVTQNINDFTGVETIKKKFTGILNNCNYWLVGGMQPEDLNQLDKMYRQSGGLSDAVKTFIATANKGRFWFKVTKQQHLPIQILQLEKEVSLVGHTE